MTPPPLKKEQDAELVPYFPFQKLSKMFECVEFSYLSLKNVEVFSSKALGGWLTVGITRILIGLHGVKNMEIYHLECTLKVL